MFNLFKRNKNYKSIGASELKTFVQNEPRVMFLDVRTPQEQKDGVMPNAKLLNYFSSTFKTELSQLDKSLTYLVYCRSGNRSSKACNMMHKLGFENIYNLKGGYQR